MREKDYGFNVGADIFTKAGTSVILVGKEGNNSKFHLDWARAKNWCISLQLKVSMIS